MVGVNVTGTVDVRPLWLSAELMVEVCMWIQWLWSVSGKEDFVVLSDPY